MGGGRHRPSGQVRRRGRTPGRPFDTGALRARGDAGATGRGRGAGRRRRGAETLATRVPPRAEQRRGSHARTSGRPDVRGSRIEQIIIRNRWTAPRTRDYFRPMPQRNIHRNVAKADRLIAVDRALQLRGMPEIDQILALVLVLILLITSGGAG